MDSIQINQRFGQISIKEDTTPPRLYIEAQGVVGPKLLQQTLKHAHAFGEKHPAGWDYIVDTTHLKVAHPLNPIWLRKIHKLPHIGRYIVINPPSPLMRLLAPLIKWLLAPDLMLFSRDEYELTENGRSHKL